MPRRRTISAISHLTRLALYTLLVLTVRCEHLQAQNTKSDVTLNRLVQAVKAIDQQQFQEAENLLNSVLATVPNDGDANNLLGVVRAKQGRPVEAEKLFRRAIVHAPKHLGARLNLSELLITTNRDEQARSVLLEAHKLAPERMEINLNLATLYADKAEYKQALHYLELLPREAANSDYFLVKLKTLLGLKQIEDARSLTRNFIQSGVGDTQSHAEFAMLLARSGLDDEGLKILETAQQNEPGSFAVRYGLGIINANLKRYDTAEEHLTAAIKVKPDDVATLRALARIARAKGNLEKSLSHLVEARRLAPKVAAVLYEFGVTTFEMDLLLDALPVFEQLHRDYANEPAYLYALAAVRWKKGETVETTRLMKKYVASRPRDAAGFYLLGAALLQQDQFPQAKAALERSLILKRDPDTEYLLAVALDKLGDRAAAIEIFRQVIRARPDHAAAYSALGTAYREDGSYTEARVALERAVELQANDLRAHYQLGLVYSKLGEKEAAKRMFARADDLRSRQRNEESVILKLIDPPN